MSRASDFEKLIPADKRLPPEWVQSLRERGSRTVYRDADLKYIGMPVSGLCSGQLYLSGDGRLWRWDIFNDVFESPHNGESYVSPPTSDAPWTPWSQGRPVEQGFALRVADDGAARVRRLDKQGFRDISFRGEYPIGYVEYRDPDCPVAVSLEAFSPFIPLNVEDSSLPATVMRYTLTNTSARHVQAELGGWLENALPVASPDGKATLLECVNAATERNTGPDRGELVFEDFQKETYEGWEVTGTAFGTGPIPRAKIPAYQGDVGGVGDRVVNSHASAPGPDKDAARGALTSRPFVIERNYILFWIGGGYFPLGDIALNLLVDDRPARTATGRSANTMRLEAFDVRNLRGKTARIRIVDNVMGGWGNIGVGRIVFADRLPAEMFNRRPDLGTMALALLDSMPGDRSGVAPATNAAAAMFECGDERTVAPGQPRVGAAIRALSLAAGESRTVNFVIAWHFPNLRVDTLPNAHRDKLRTPQGRWYATRFDSAAAAARYVAANYPRLRRQTQAWHDTWYDSTLPYWFLDRTLASASALAAATCARFSDGRFYAWEGVGRGCGTCTHVWSYEQAMGRLFPALDILLRERVDFNPAIGFKPDGLIDHRGEFGAGPAIDGQAGTILRTYRDHQMSPDDAFLRRNWPAVRKAVEWLIVQPGGETGILTGAQHNTLDSAWYGLSSWLSGLYLAAVRAGAEMAEEMGDDAFAVRCRNIVEAGRKAFAPLLFNGEYFVNKPDPQHPDAVNSGAGCLIDQVYGQSWAFQVGLGRILPERETKQALASLWKYNFAPDVGPYRNANKPGRRYAVGGEAGLLMCTFPRPEWTFAQASGRGPDSGYASYFNECMSGFEHQVAAHMIWEGMVEQGLAIERAIHDRYHASKRNPWNEVEFGEHYARAMAAYGAFIAACGYEHHGPKGYLAFAPRLSPAHFRAAFTAATGWGSYSQTLGENEATFAIELRYGTLRLKTVALALPAPPRRVTSTVRGVAVDVSHRFERSRMLLTFDREAVVNAGQKIEIVVR